MKPLEVVPVNFASDLSLVERIADLISDKLPDSFAEVRVRDAIDITIDEQPQIYTGARLSNFRVFDMRQDKRNVVAGFFMDMYPGSKIVVVTNSGVLSGRFMAHGAVNDIGGDVAIASTYLVEGEEPSSTDPDPLFIGLHEAGHLVGLRHCTGEVPPNYYCAMNQSNRDYETNAFNFCAGCRGQLPSSASNSNCD